MNANIAKLQEAVKRAGAELDAALRVEFPEGRRVGVRLKHGQQNWTCGIVNRVCGGEVQVNFPNARRPYRLIRPEDIMEIGEQA
jgi:hypothetical protein